MSRLVVPGFPHHVTQRGNRRAPIFFEDGDYSLYRDLLAERCRKAAVACWAYCLMPNHVHLILTPATDDALARALGETHRRYTGFVNARARWTGHLVQGRSASVVLDDDHLMTPRAMSRSTPSGPVWRVGRRTGRGRASPPISPDVTTLSSRWRRCSNVSAT
jgi:REP element-mobilizing transposase RayT